MAYHVFIYGFAWDTMATTIVRNLTRTFAFGLALISMLAMQPFVSAQDHLKGEIHIDDGVPEITVFEDPLTVNVDDWVYLSEYIWETRSTHERYEVYGEIWCNYVARGGADDADVDANEEIDPEELLYDNWGACRAASPGQLHVRAKVTVTSYNVWNVPTGNVSDDEFFWVTVVP